MRVETGVMVMKDGKAWGIIYEDGQATAYGFTDPENATIHDPEFCRQTTDVTYKNSPDTKELLTAKLVHVERRTEVVFK